jgi:hypothetical protein
VLNWSLGGDVFTVHTFEPRLVNYGLEYTANAQLASYWQLSIGGNFDRARWLTSALRGGRTLRVDPTSGVYLNVTTDTRKPVWLSLGASGSRTEGSGSYDGGVDVGATIQARSNLDLFIGPSLYVRDDAMQYVTEVADAGGGPPHYVFARIRATDVALTLRLNWTFSPRLTLQAYAQPYLSSGRYAEYKDVDDPGAARYSDRFRLLAPGEYSFDPSPDPGVLQLDRPDFNFREVRSTVVMRWEYRPGSTVFAIWSHGRTSDTFDDGRFRFGRDLSALGRAPSEDVVMVKVNYWIGL